MRVKARAKAATTNARGWGNASPPRAYRHYENECKYQGGCGKSVATNECNKKGECAVPLLEGTWKRAYEKFKADMTKAGGSGEPEPPGPPKS